MLLTAPMNLIVSLGNIPQIKKKVKIVDTLDLERWNKALLKQALLQGISLKKLKSFNAQFLCIDRTRNIITNNVYVKSA